MAMIVKVPPHCGHCAMSIPNTRLYYRTPLRRTGVQRRGIFAAEPFPRRTTT
ncbi:MAG: hypothetical protein ACREWE_00735 [Gammaproteobacteria bacterium]